MDYSEHILRISTLIRLMHDACNAKDWITATGFANEIPAGALLLVSDQPMIPEGVKTAESDVKVSATFVENHINIGIDSLKQIMNHGQTVKHLKF